MNILVTGGAGFIGSNFLNLFVPRHPQAHFINFDALTYAANPANLSAVETLPNYVFIKGDIADEAAVDKLFAQYNPDLVFHFAAESHVDRSILGPAEFIRTNIQGTFHLLESCRKRWQNASGKLFLHVSTDEVYGSLGPEGRFTEQSPYDPSSPYSASKAASDHLAGAYFRTYELPVIICNCSNNYGPFQFPEKLIPLMILYALAEKELPVYGKGENVRDWLFVEDHCRALWLAAHQGVPGETYIVGGDNEWKNIDLVRLICDTLAGELGRDPAFYRGLIRFVADRPGHDLRYAVDCAKIKRDLGWRSEESFSGGLKKTVQWYLHNPGWVESVQSGDYRRWIEENYGRR